MVMSSIKSIVQSYEAVLIPPQGNRQAAVAMLLRGLESEPQMFFIERARNENDPWSGQIAFPGGNRKPTDQDTFNTAQRETLEEVGIELRKDILLGRLDDQQGSYKPHFLPLVISCYVFHWDEQSLTQNNMEVGDSFWVDFDLLVRPDNRIDYFTRYSSQPFPGIMLGKDRVLWGLTYRFVQMLLEKAFPQISEQVK